MNRSNLIKELTENKFIRVWQAIRNTSEYAFVYGSKRPTPVRENYKTLMDYEQACADFVDQLDDTFYKEDS